MSIDLSTHSLFGASKAAADLLVQEYGRYFEMPTVCFRGGCLTGPQHAGAKLHGFLAYLMKCVVTGTPYTVFGYAGKQVRDNIHSADLVAAFEAFRARPAARPPSTTSAAAATRTARCSRRSRPASGSPGASSSGSSGPEPRIGDHRWWISDLAPFEADYPGLVAALRDRRHPHRDARAERRALDGSGRLTAAARGPLERCCSTTIVAGARGVRTPRSSPSARWRSRFATSSKSFEIPLERVDSIKERVLHPFASRETAPAEGARGDLVRRPPRRVLRHRRPQRHRQEHPAEDPRQHLRAPTRARSGWRAGSRRSSSSGSASTSS